MSTYINPLKPNERSDYKDCPALVKDYLKYSESIRGLSIRTVNAYYIDLRTFFKFLVWHRGLVAKDTELAGIEIKFVDIAFIKKIDKAEIYEFLYYVTRERENVAVTRARKLSSIKGFFKYLTVTINKLEHNPVIDIDSPKAKKSLPKFLSLEESYSLLNNIQSDYYEREYCIITLFLNCGMRLSELVGLNMKDIKDDTLRVIGKGNKERFIYLNDACMKALSTLIDENKKIAKLKDKEALFVSKIRGNRLSARRVQQLVSNCLQVAGLSDKGYSVHKLRHTAATLLYKYGNVDMLVLKEVLGHESVATTQIYTHLDKEKLKEAAAASPLSGLSLKKPIVEKTGKHVENLVETVEKSEIKKKSNLDKL